MVEMGKQDSQTRHTSKIGSALEFTIVLMMFLLIYAKISLEISKP